MAKRSRPAPEAQPAPLLVFAQAPAAAARPVAPAPAIISSGAAAAQARLAAGDLTGAAELAQRQLAATPGDGTLWNLLGIARLGLGDPAGARDALIKAGETLPNDPAVAEQLGVALANLGDADGANRCFQRSIKLAPQRAEPRVHAARLANARGRFGDAERHARAAIGCQRQDAGAHHLLAVALHGQGQGAAAQDSCRQALAIDPNFPLPRLLLCTLLNEAGETEAAIAQARQGLRQLMNPRHARTPLRKRPPLSLPSTRQALADARELLEHGGFPFCLFAGTLLGIYRDGDLLPHDKDADLALPGDVDRDRLLGTLTADGRFSVAKRAIDDRRWLLPLQHSATGTSIDLLFLLPDGEFFRCGLPQRPQPLLCRISRFGFATHRWQDRDWPIPDAPERYLAEVYGPGWRQPDPHFDTILSNPSRIPEAIPGALFFGYFRLFERLLVGDWPKADAYCRQILARRDDSLLPELQAWLASLPPAVAGNDAAP